MLVLKRKDRQWVEIRHVWSNDSIWVCVRRGEPPDAECELIFDDRARNFEVRRPERRKNGHV